MRSAAELLAPLVPDDRTIRLDCTERHLLELLPRLSVCGVHLATDAEVADLGFKENSIVPDDPAPLSAEDVARLRPFLADRGTPPGLCLGFGRVRGTDPVIADILAEAARPQFQPHQGSLYALGSHKGRLLGVLTAQPGTRTTTVVDPRLEQYSESRRGTWVGMHYDNSLTKSGEGERFPAGVRVAQTDRRILLNAGPGPRRLVTALTMTALHLSEAVRPGDPEHIPDSSQLQSFLRAHPERVGEITCLVTTQRPGDYLVFPAGVTLHDGSMLGADEKSVAIVLGGRFARRDEPAEER